VSLSHTDINHQHLTVGRKCLKIQEGWLSSTERASVSAISLRHIIWLPYLRRITPVCRCLHPFCGWRHLATSRESKAHFGLPWVRPCDNRSKCYMGEKRIQCLSNASQHVPIYLQPFPVSSKVRHLAHFLHILASPGYAPGHEQRPGVHIQAV